MQVTTLGTGEEGTSITMDYPHYFKLQEFLAQGIHIISMEFEVRKGGYMNWNSIQLAVIADRVVDIYKWAPE